MKIGFIGQGYVAKLIKKMINSKFKVLIKDCPVGEVNRYEADISKLRKMGWSPNVELEEGIKRSINYYINS
jgi:UDP-glucose 4-epimerase